MKNTLYLLLLIVFCTSCSSDVTIEFPAKFVRNNTVILNEEINLKDRLSLIERDDDPEYATVVIPSGTVTVDINGEKTEIKTKKGGILNLDEKELVFFYLYFGDRKPMQGHFGAIVDSIFYYPKRPMFKNSEGAPYYRRMADKNALGPLKPENAGSSEVMVIRKQDLFTEKVWDYGISEEIPEEVEVRVQKNAIGAMAKKSTVRSASYFMVYAMLSDLYEREDLKQKKAEVTTETLEATEANE